MVSVSREMKELEDSGLNLCLCWRRGLVRDDPGIQVLADPVSMRREKDWEGVPMSRVV